MGWIQKVNKQGRHNAHAKDRPGRQDGRYRVPRHREQIQDVSLDMAAVHPLLESSVVFGSSI